MIVPSLLGLSARRYIGDERFEAAKPYIKLGNFVVPLLLNYANAALVLPKVAEVPDADLLAAVLVIVSALCIAGFGSGLLLSRWLAVNRGEAASLTFALGMNNNGAGLVLAPVALADHPQVILPIATISSSISSRLSSISPAASRRGIDSGKLRQLGAAFGHLGRKQNKDSVKTQILRFPCCLRRQFT